MSANACFLDHRDGDRGVILAVARFRRRGSSWLSCGLLLRSATAIGSDTASDLASVHPSIGKSVLFRAVAVSPVCVAMNYRGSTTLRRTSSCNNPWPCGTFQYRQVHRHAVRVHLAELDTPNLLYRFVLTFSCNCILKILGVPSVRIAIPVVIEFNSCSGPICQSTAMAS